MDVASATSFLGVVVHFVYDAFGQLAVEHQSGGTVEPGTRYLTQDWLGSTRVVTTGGGAVTARNDFLPFGRPIYAGQNGRTEAMKYGPAPSGSTGRPAIRQLFTGHERDVEVDSALDYMQARHYSGAMGRMMSADEPLADQNPGDPQSWSLYGYVRNNPLRFIDPTGQTISFVNQEDEEQFKRYEAALAKDSKRYASQIATVDQLRKSKVNYSFHVGGKQKSESAEGNVGFDGANVTVNIRNVGGPSGEKFSLTGRIRHELEHARQVDSGELTFLQDVKGNYIPSPTTYDAMDEVRAFQAQLGLTSPIEISKSATLSNLGMARTDREAANVIIQAYPHLRSRPTSSVYRVPASLGQPGDIIRTGGFGRIHSNR